MICAVIARKTFPEIISLLPNFSMAEIRLDLLTLNPEEINVVFSSHPRLIATYRRNDSVPDSNRLETFRQALESGAWAADIDLNDPPSFISAVKGQGSRLILSFHDFNKTPPAADLEKTLYTMKRKDPDFIKIATFAHDTDDLLRLMTLYNNPAAGGIPLVLLSMGPQGVLSRVGAPLLGAPFTYAAADETSLTAPGQLTVSRMETLLSLLEKNEAVKGDLP